MDRRGDRVLDGALDGGQLAAARGPEDVVVRVEADYAGEARGVLRQYGGVLDLAVLVDGEVAVGAVDGEEGCLGGAGRGVVCEAGGR